MRTKLVVFVAMLFLGCATVGILEYSSNSLVYAAPPADTMMAGAMIASVGASSTPIRRVAWQQGFRGTIDLLTIVGPQNVDIGPGTVAPDEAEIYIHEGKVRMEWQPLAPGVHNIPIEVYNTTPPALPNWEGESVTLSQTVQVQILVYSLGAADFLVGGPDTLVAP